MGFKSEFKGLSSVSKVSLYLIWWGYVWRIVWNALGFEANNRMATGAQLLLLLVPNVYYRCEANLAAAAAATLSV